MSEFSDESMLASIAVIGMSCRFPMASNADEYWKNIAAGVESITDLGDDELAPELVSDPNYVKRSGQLQDVELFDRDFFEMSAREASITSPAQRLLLLCAYEALEDAAYVPRHYPGAIGVYVGANKCDEWQKRIYDLTGREMREFAKRLQFSIGNDLDYCAACSTSLVAISQACKGLLAYDCDMALAGGSCVTLPLKSGYWYEAGGLLSRDGCCRPFDARADGTVPGNGAGIVLLKRLLEAVEDGDHIYAIVRGTAVNNDGAAKVGYTAPSVKGQSRVISSALAFSEVNPETISYVEAHGMGTPLGDPMELESLSKAYGTITDKKRYCAIGAVKSNIGHLGAAAGVAGFIKAVMALKNQQIPPSLHYHEGSVPRRAAVNSFGVGGTNAHVILEEAPVRHSASFPRQTHLLLLSAKSEQALVKMIDNLADALESTPQRELADVSYTLQVGRDTYPYRYSLVCSTLQEAIAELRNSEHEIECTRVKPEGITLSYLFPGEGTQHVDMALNLYRHETVFRDTLDECAKIINPLLQRDLREILYPKSADKEWAETVLKQTRIALPALFMVEYSLARLWQSWGVRPNNMLGHCVGEYVAACISGVFELSIGLQLAVVRGSLQELNDDTENKLESIFQQANLSAPTIPFISNLTGGWISDEQAKDPSYWYKQLSANMPINQGLCSLLEDESLLLLEVGPGQTLVNGLAKIHSEKISKTLASCSDVKHHGSDQAYLMQTLGQLWMSGVVPDWEQFYACQQRYRVALPLYPFQGKRYWLDTATVTAEEGLSQQTSSPSDDRFSHLDREVTPSVDNRNLFSNLTIVPAEKRISMLKGFVQKIVKNLFGSDEISEQIPFIEMGMSSLMAIELRTQVCNALDIDTISVLMILAEDTNINRLVQLLNEELTTTEHNGADLCLTLPEMENKNNRIQSSVVPDPDNQYQPFPLTDIQQAYWLGRQGIFEGGNVATYVYIEKDIQDLDIVRFEQALNALIKRHHMLRMVVENDGQQRFLEYVPEYKIAFQDLTQYDKKAEQQALDKVRQAMSHQVFATDRWPLFEFRISQYEGEHYRLHCGFDFLIVDGSSLQIFFRDLFLIYAGEEKRLSPLEINFRECLNATQVNPESALYKKSEAYWMARVNSLPPAPALPRAREIWQIPEPKFVRREFSLDAQTWDNHIQSASPASTDIRCDRGLYVFNTAGS
ncbi:MAG: beta-ketoacyl synthase N-terminal-like domain-containing protein [Exilibacterium sp.]